MLIKETFYGKIVKKTVRIEVNTFVEVDGPPIRCLRFRFNQHRNDEEHIGEELKCEEFLS